MLQTISSIAGSISKELFLTYKKIERNREKTGRNNQETASAKKKRWGLKTANLKTASLKTAS